MDKTLRPFGCDTCNATFTKKYNLDRHTKNIHENIDSNDSVDKSDANKNDTITHHDTIPFGMDGISTLSLSEQCEVFEHDTNSIESILLKINLNENKSTHHNVCISSLSKGYGFIFNGSEWVSETINTIMTTILVSKERDLNLIYENIRQTLSKELNTFILYKLKECRCTISNKKMRKTLIQNLKKHLYNKRHFAINVRNETTMHKNNVSNSISSINSADICQYNIALNMITPSNYYNPTMVSIFDNDQYLIELVGAPLYFLFTHNLINHDEIMCIIQKINKVGYAGNIKKIVSIVLKHAFRGKYITNKLLTSELLLSEQIDKFTNETNNISKSEDPIEI